MNRGVRDRSAAPIEPDLAPFRLGATDEEWLASVRRAARPGSLGQLGGYELLEEVSRGAQGVVYRARRSRDAEVVAVKRLLGGAFATTVARARFERELEAVAALSHPNIVRAAGLEAPDPHPLLVMEWIDGVPIDRWADAGRAAGRSLDVILGVFLKVCDAVHHAHQRGVIHRDLKPSNLLVDGAGEPHLLDFGLAKLIGLEAGRGSTVTGTHDFVGTPAYAAPEQVRGNQDAIDIRTDIYALGVVLFRMLTGRLPFDSSRGLADLLADIQTAEIARPSRWNRALHDDLDAIIGKAMARDPERRYASVDALMADVRGYLAGEPIEAQRGRRWYELRSTIRRHRAAVGVMLAVLLLVSGSTVVLWRMYLHQGQLLAQVTSARDAEARARQSAQRQQTVLEELLAAAAEIGKGTDLAVRRAWLDEASALVEADLADDPAAQAATHDAIGRTYQSLAIYPEAEQHLQAALDLRRAEHSGDHPALATSLHHFGTLLQDCNRFAQAEPFLREALDMRRRLFPAGHPDLAESLDSVGFILQYRDDFAGADAMHEEALAMVRRLFGERHAEAAETLNFLGNSQLRQSRFADAERMFREALDIQVALLGDDHRAVAGTRINLAKALFCLGEYDEAEPLFRAAIDTYRQLLGSSHDNVAWGLHRLGILLHARGDFDQSEAALRESLAIYRRCFGDQDHYVALVLDSLGTLLLDRGELTAAKDLFDEASAIHSHLDRGDGAGSVWRVNRLAEWLERTGDHAAAEPLLGAIAEDPPRFEGMDLIGFLRCVRSLARILQARGDLAAAQARLNEAIDLGRNRLGADHPAVGQALVQLACVLRAEGRPQEADRVVAEALQILRRSLDDTHPELAYALFEQARIAEELGDPDRARPIRDEALRICALGDCPYAGSH